MPGKTGKRAKPPTPCRECGKPIPRGPFMRERDGDRHEECWWTKRDALKREPPKPEGNR